MRGLPAHSRRRRSARRLGGASRILSGRPPDHRRDQSKIDALIGNSAALRALSPTEFVDDRFGLPTVTDILRELEKPGRDPRPAFKTAEFKAGVETLNDLEPGMVLEGVVTNVAAFGAFVDVGVHQDGLVHVSAMSKTFVKDPRSLVKPGDIVRVKVLEVDKPRKRIALTLRLDDEAGKQPARGGGRPEPGGASKTRSGARAGCQAERAGQCDGRCVAKGGLGHAQVAPAGGRGVLPIHLASDDWWPLVVRCAGSGSSRSNFEKSMPVTRDMPDRCRSRCFSASAASMRARSRAASMLTSMIG